MSRAHEEAMEMARVGALTRADLAAVSVAPAVDSFDAIRTMGLRLQGFDLSTLAAIAFDIREAAKGSAWRVAVSVRRATSALTLDVDALELHVKSDIGALELAGHSIREARRVPPPIESCPSFCPQRVYAPTWIATAPTVAGALHDVRLSMVRALDDRIRSGLATLRENGRDLDLGEGWTPPGPVVFTVPSSTVVEEISCLPGPGMSKP